MTSENPFVYGEIVTAGAFADREGERDRLSRDLAAGQKVFLISPRRYGKSSLIRDVMRGLARQRILTDRSDGRRLELIRRVPRVVRTCARVGRHAGGPLATVDHRAAARHHPGTAIRRHRRRRCQVLARLPQCPNLPRGRAVGRRGLRASRPNCCRPQSTTGDRAGRVSDDCQLRWRQRRTSAARSGPGATTGWLRVCRLGAVVDGTDARAATAVLQGGTRAASRRRLTRTPSPGSSTHGLPRAASSSSLAWVRRSSNWPATSPTTCSASRTRPGTTCRTGGRRTAGLEDLHLTLSRLLGEQNTIFEESWQRLTLPQRAVLRALVLEHGRELLSADVRARYRLPGASSVQSALAALARQDVVLKGESGYVVSDSLYREWVARRTF